MDPYGPFRSRMVFYGPRMVLYGPLWLHMVPYGPVWSLYGPIWSRMVSYGPVWSRMHNSIKLSWVVRVTASCARTCEGFMSVNIS